MITDLDTHTLDDDLCVVCGFDKRTDRVRPCKTRRVNKRRHAFHVDVTRPSIWGNPFVIGPDGTRNDVVEKYDIWLSLHPQLLARLPEIRGRILGCVCSEYDECHADVLIRRADALEEE